MPLLLAKYSIQLLFFSKGYIKYCYNWVYTQTYQTGHITSENPNIYREYTHLHSYCLFAELNRKNKRWHFDFRMLQNDIKCYFCQNVTFYCSCLMLIEANDYKLCTQKYTKNAIVNFVSWVSIRMCIYTHIIYINILQIIYICTYIVFVFCN